MESGKLFSIQNERLKIKHRTTNFNSILIFESLNLFNLFARREKNQFPISDLETLSRTNSNFNYSNIYICWQINFKINLTKKKRKGERERESKLVSNFKAPSAISELLLCNNKGDRIDRALCYLLFRVR